MYVRGSGTPINALFVDATSGNVGVGTNAPAQALDVQGAVRIADGTENAGYVLTSDATGNASWQAAAGGDNLGNHVITTPMTSQLPTAIDLGDDARLVDVNASGVVALQGQTDPSIGALLFGNSAFPETVVAPQDWR